MKWSYFAIHRKIKICMKTACEGRATALFMRFAGRGDTRKLCTAPWKTARVRGLLGLRSHLAIPWKLALSSSLVLPFRQDDIDLLFPGCIRSLSLSLAPAIRTCGRITARFHFESRSKGRNNGSFSTVHINCLAAMGGRRPLQRNVIS